MQRSERSGNPKVRAKARSERGRTTPKGGHADHHGHPDASRRYTPPIPPEIRHSPAWLPYVIIALLLGGGLVLFLTYAVFEGSGIGLLSGLGLVLLSLLLATRYH